MSGMRQNEIQKIQGRLTVTQALWDHEREQILQALGIADDDINPRAWSTEDLVNEIKDCIAGERLLRAEEQWLAGRRIEKLVELAPNDFELQRAWKTFPGPVADNDGFTWGYLATELIDQHWVHIFVHDLHPADNRRTYARVPARPAWAP